jgi:TonB family protein
MLDPQRACPRSALGLVMVGLCAFGLACAPSSPPAAPDPAATATTEPLEEPAAVTAEPAASDSELTEPTAADPAPADPAAARGPRDARGKEEIQQVMASNRDKVRACYDAALARNAGIAGDLVLSFTIDPRGDVKQAEVNWSESDLHIPELDTCAVDAVRSFKFPPSSRGLESKVNYPFNFNPPRTEPPPAKR